ncbi:MAG: type I restriction enzyme HsdR N-terminal domain-containing protein [Cyclobacteriaceae bacterium]
MVASNMIYEGKALNLPPFNFKIKTGETGKFLIFDELRKKWLMLTPEEWVRQHIIKYLVEHKGYPKSLFALEKGIWYNEMRKRFDVLVLDRMGGPFFLIECKAPEIKLTQKTVEQVCLYNKKIGAAFLGISNGNAHIFMEKQVNEEKYLQINHFPVFK